MKKLMTSLLAVLLCGIGFLWAQPYTVEFKIGFVGATSSDTWTEGTVTLTPTSGGTARSNTVNYRDGMPAPTTIGGLSSGTYKLSFTGVANGKTYTYEEAPFSIYGNMQGSNAKTITATASNSTNMKVYVVYPSNGNLEQLYNNDYISGASVTFKASDEEGNGTTLTTAAEGYSNPFVTFNADNSKTYTIKVVANQFKEKEMTNVSPVAELKIPVDPVTVTVQGAVKVGEKTVAELPEGMSLKLRSVFNNNNIVNSVTVNADGYKAENVKVGTGSATMTVEPESNYSVTSPTNGSFTIADNENHTVTQDIVISKTAASVFIKTNPEDNINQFGELQLTGGNLTQTMYANKKTEDGTFEFNGLAPGTYTVVFEKFLYKLKGEAPTVTIGADYADQTIELEIEASEQTVTIEGTAQLKDGFTPHPLNGAEVKLYARGGIAADGNSYERGELLDTKTTGEDGKFSFSQTISKTTSYLISITHNDILPYEQNITASNISNELTNISLKSLWISGSITNSDDLVGELTVTATCNGQTYVIKNNDYIYFYGKYDKDNAKYYIYSENILTAGTYTVTVNGKDINGFMMAATEEMTITEAAVTKDLTLAKDADKGYMTIRLRYQNTTGKTLPVKNMQFKFNNKYNHTDEYGNAVFLMEKGSSSSFSSDKAPYQGYDAVTIENINAFREIQGEMVPNDTTIFIPGLEPTLVKISGTVTMPEGVGSDVKVALQTPRDLEVVSTPIVKTGDSYTYTFADVPVAASSTMYLFLVEPDAKYDAKYNIHVPYNYAVAANTYVSANPINMPAENTQDITVVKIACNVSGSVSPAKTGEVTLTKQGESKPDATYGYAEIYGQGTYKFQGVPAGTYTLAVKCPGYAPATKEVTVEATLTDVTVDAITLDAVPMTVTVSGSLTANHNDKTYYFDGAELSIWNSDGTQKLAEATMPEKESYGHIPSDFTFEATAGTKVLFKMTHPSIEDVAKEYTVTKENLTIYASDLNYVFVEGGDDDYVVMTGFKPEWKADYSGLNLSWTWPEGADGKIKKITLRRKLSGETGNGVELTTWEATGDNPQGRYTFAAAELPVAYADTVTVSTSYAYLFEILYADLHRENVWFTADMRDGVRYKLTYTVNDDKMGTISSYMQPEGDYMEGDAITVTATAKPGYKFVEFLKNDQKLTEAELGRITLLGSDRDSVAIFGFNMPAEDLTVKAVFAAKGQAPDVTVEYTVTLVSSNEAWGTVSGAGKFEEGTEIEVKATVTDAAKYKFVAWKEGDKEVSKDATYKFKVEKDITLTAVFEEVTANENLKAARWAIFAEDGAIVIKGINGDRYDIYDLNGRLSGSALCTGAEIRLGVAKSKLYIVRRLGADGSFDAKKIVVR